LKGRLNALAHSIHSLQMFERYTEKARRAVLFARFEASQSASPAIEPEHMLLGILRENKELFVNAVITPLWQHDSTDLDTSSTKRNWALPKNQST
jgi:hypothetical protein